MEPATSALEVWQSLNPWTAGEVPIFLSKRSICRFRISREKKKENGLSQDNRVLPLKADVFILVNPLRSLSGIFDQLILPAIQGICA